MRVLLVHNRYRSAAPSGENRVVEEEATQLRAAGHDVTEYVRDSDDIVAGRVGAAGLAVGPVYSRQGVREFTALLRQHRPQVVHLHNVYPLISPWVIRTAHGADCPVVQTVHNYRHVCVKGSLFRDGRPCEDCLARRIGWPAVVHGCYRGSRPQSAAMVTGQAVHRSTWRSVDRLLPVSSFVARKLVEGGFAPERITVRHQGIEDAGASRPPGTGAVFVGRLDTEKGVEELLTAWVTGGFEAETLTLVGDGPLRARAERLAATTSGLTVLGSIPPREVREVMLRSAFVVIPSRWYEGLPRAAVEALMLGRPIVASDIGSLRDLVSADVGWLTAPTAAGIIDGLRRAFADPELTAKGRAARGLYLAEFTPGESLRRLVGIYEDVAAGLGPSPVAR